jgi:dipeptidyl aminopeptidase/acylaminoacyl peptidase
MSIAKGGMLSHYRLDGKIGEGGMGEVWKATDTTLGRPVAIKILPEIFAEDRERLARFEREAKLLASLNHPNIAVIHGLHRAEGVHFLAMELVEGEDLSRRLQRGALPVEEAVAIAKQVAEALEAAHESGVIHRDLKPANIQLTPGGKAKVLDFGLAKAFETESGPGNSSLSPTMTSAGTRMGMILGTAAYMSPEQARGRAVDRRADIWSFGCVLYEMLAGKQTFMGETVSDTLAAVLRAEPDLEALPAETPGALRRLLRRCLRKDPRQRLRDIGDARILLEEVAGGTADEFAPAPLLPAVPARRKSTTVLWLSGIIIAAAAGGFVSWGLRPASPRPPLRKFLMTVKDLEAFYRQSPMLSPDGKRIAYSAGGRFWIRDLDQLKAREVPGSDGGRVPIWSPDGSFLAYTAGNKLWKLPSAGGQPVAVCDLPAAIDGGAWSPSDTIVLAASTGALYEVSALGGDPRPILEPVDGKETDFHKPSFLPGGGALIFGIHRTEGVDTLALLSGKTRKVLLQIPGARLDNPTYSSTGHIVYAREGGNAGIYAVPFSPEKLELMGEPFLVDPEGSLPSVSVDGTLAFVRGAGQGVTHLVWVDRAGKVLEPVGQPMREIFTPVLSPDGRKVAVSADENGNRDVWIEDIARGTRTRLTFDPSLDFPQAWSPAGDRVFFINGPIGSGTIASKAADGTGEIRVHTKGDAFSLAPGGKLAVFTLRDPRAKEDLWTLSLEGEAKPALLLQTPARERYPAVSPDGQYVAYVSDESGREEIYLTRFPAGGGKWQVSVDGGLFPVWARKSGELFYRNVMDQMAVSVTTRPSLELGTPRKLFSGPPSRLLMGPGVRYDVTPDGQRILAVQYAGEPTAETGITLVENWLAEFKGR